MVVLVSYDAQGREDAQPAHGREQGCTVVKGEGGRIVVVM